VSVPRLSYAPDYAVDVMSAARHPSLLAAAALGAVGDGADATDIGERLARAGARLDPGVADGLLGELASLGLVRVARSSGAWRRYVLTTLGQKALGDGLLGGHSERLADLERLRTDLVATIAHELRTPLTALRTSAGLLVDPPTEPTPEQQRVLIDAIVRNADRMQRLVEDVLDLARFRSGSIRLQSRRFDPVELGRSAVATLIPLATERRVEVVVNVTGEPGAVYGDRRRLEQALVNLVSNAIRFSPEGGTVEVRVAAAEDHTTWTVADEGPGIPDDEQARLFERFFVGRTDRHGAREGVGLGLPTALAIAQAHAGTIDVSSTLGSGSVFAVRVPTDGPPEAE
jgi:signal transduction histidine kinase